MAMNWMAILAAAFIPLILGFLWYNPKLFGNAWMKEAKVTEDMMKEGNMGLIFGISFVLSIILSLFINANFIHQNSVAGLVIGSEAETAGTAINETYTAFKTYFADVHRTPTHGLVHGLVFGIMFLLPVIATNALFERKSWKYIFINLGYWTVSLMIMGAIICAWQ